MIEYLAKLGVWFLRYHTCLQTDKTCSSELIYSGITVGGVIDLEGVIQTSLGGVDPMTSDNTPLSSDPNSDSSSRVNHP